MSDSNFMEQNRISDECKYSNKDFYNEEDNHDIIINVHGNNMYICWKYKCRHAYGVSATTHQSGLATLWSV